MERYDIEKQYEEDEIDLTELLKTIIKERKIVIVITVLCTIIASGFTFYKKNQMQNYGANITFSEETLDKIKQYNSAYKNAVFLLNQSIQSSFDTLLNDNNSSDVIVISAEDKQKIKETMDKEYKFIKIINSKDKNYKLFTKTKSHDIKAIEEKINEIVKKDMEIIDSEFNKNISEILISSEGELQNIIEETENLNKKIMNVVKENFRDVSKENMSSNLSIIAPVLYVEYQQKINALNNSYLKVQELKKIKEDSKEFFEFSGEDDIVLITLKDASSSEAVNGKLIIAIGIIFGLFAGMFLAVIKKPVIDILREIKEEK